MTDQDLEAIHERLALQIDAAGPDHSELFLAKLALLLCHELGDRDRAERCIEEAAQNLDQ